MPIPELFRDETAKVFQTLENLGIPSGYLEDKQNFVLDCCWMMDDLYEVTEIVFDDFSAERADGLY